MEQGTVNTSSPNLPPPTGKDPPSTLQDNPEGRMADSANAAAQTRASAVRSAGSNPAQKSRKHSSKPVADQPDTLVEEIRELFILDGLARGEIKKRLKVDHKTISDSKLDEIIDRTYQALIKTGQRDGSGNRYLINNGQVFRAKGRGDESYLQKLTNFLLLSIGRIVRDDGVEKHHSFEIEAKLGERQVRAELSVDEFYQMRWPIAVLGPGALVTPRTEPEARYGLQATAQKTPERLIYTHTGWRLIDGKPYFLHANGAIGVDGNRPDVKATLLGNLRSFSLPDPPTGDELKTAVSASLGFLDVANDSVSFPLLAAIYRAPLGDAALTVYSSGTTGLRKTAVNLIAQQHYGMDFDENSVLHWDSTSNFLKEDLFIAKDSVLLVDDFVLTGGTREMRKANSAAEDVIRGVGNRAGRGRLGRDGKPQIPHEPRGLMLSTGETRPPGQSLTTRTVHLSFTKDSVRNQSLTQSQTDAKAGLCAQAMSAYLQYVASHYQQVREQLKLRTDELRKLLATEERLLRSANNLASLAVGFEVFLSFAIDTSAITESEADQLWKRLWRTFSKLAAVQDDLQKSEDPTREVLHRLNSAFLNQKIYLKDPDSGEGRVGDGVAKPPANAMWVGWKQSAKEDGDEDWYCEPDALFSAIVQLYRDHGSTLPWTKEILWQRLAEQGYTRGKGERTQYFRKSIEGKQHRLIYIPAESFRRIDAEGETAKDAEPITPARRSWQSEEPTSANQVG